MSTNPVDQITADITQAIADPGALVSEFKKGYTTSEFWVSGIALLVPVVAYAAQLFGYHVSTAELSASLTGFVPAVGYIIGRSWLKKSRVAAVASVVASTPSVGVGVPIVVPAAPVDPAPVATADIAAGVTAPDSAPVVDAVPAPAAPALSPLAQQIQTEVATQVSAAIANLMTTETTPPPPAA